MTTHVTRSSWVDEKQDTETEAVEYAPISSIDLDVDIKESRTRDDIYTSSEDDTSEDSSSEDEDDLEVHQKDADAPSADAIPPQGEKDADESSSDETETDSEDGSSEEDKETTGFAEFDERKRLAKCHDASELESAIASGDLQAAESMLANGYDANIIPCASPGGDPKFHTPIIAAVRFKNLDMIRLLVQHRADIDAGNGMVHRVALEVDQSPYPIVKYLFSMSKDRLGFLVDACQHMKSPDVGKLIAHMLSFDMDVNAFSETRQRTPLMASVDGQNIFAAEYLVGDGEANVRASAHGKKAIDFATDPAFRDLLTKKMSGF